MTAPRAALVVTLVVLSACVFVACGGRSSGTRSRAARDCRAGPDRTAAVNALIAAARDGSTLTFPRDGCFRVDGTVRVVGRHGLVVDGRGTTFVRRVAMPDAFSPQWLVQGSTGITIRDVRIEGPKPDPSGFTHAYEGEPGMAIDNSRRISVEHSHVTSVWGDFFRISNATDTVRITGNRLVQAGRQGLAVVGGTHITFDGNLVSNTGRFSIDLEPYPSTPVRAVVIRDNRLVRPTYGFICATGFDPRCRRGPALSGVTATGNTQEQ